MIKKELSPDEEGTINYYDTHALEWSEKHGLDGRNLHFLEDMKYFFEFLPEGRVLEIGSGHGGDAIRLLKHYGIENYIGADASRGLLRIASCMPASTQRRVKS